MGAAFSFGPWICGNGTSDDGFRERQMGTKSTRPCVRAHPQISSWSLSVWAIASFSLLAFQQSPFLEAVSASVSTEIKILASRMPPRWMIQTRTLFEPPQRLPLRLALHRTSLSTSFRRCATNVRPNRGYPGNYPHLFATSKIKKEYFASDRQNRLISKRGIP